MLRARLKEQKIQTKLKEDKKVVDYSEEELEYLGTPLGKANYSGEVSKEEPKSSVPRWKQYVECEICGKKYQRSCVTHHRKTQRHRIYAVANKKIVGLLTKGID